MDYEFDVTDWKGNLIKEGDKIKLICFQKLKNVEKAKQQPGEIHYVLPEKIDLLNTVEPQVIKSGDKEVDWCFVTLLEKDVINPFGESPLCIYLDGMMYMTVRAIVDLTKYYMNNCIVAIEGKSDDQEEFFMNHFEV